MNTLLQTKAALVAAFFTATACAQAPAVVKESGTLRAEGSAEVVLVRPDQSLVSLGCVPAPILRENLGRYVELEGLASPTSNPAVSSHLCVRKMAVPPKGTAGPVAAPAK